MSLSVSDFCWICFSFREYFNCRVDQFDSSSICLPYVMCCCWFLSSRFEFLHECKWWKMNEMSSVVLKCKCKRALAGHTHLSNEQTSWLQEKEIQIFTVHVGIANIKRVRCGRRVANIYGKDVGLESSLLAVNTSSTKGVNNLVNLEFIFSWSVKCCCESGMGNSKVSSSVRFD